MVILRIRNVAYTVSVTLPCGACYFRGGETAGGPEASVREEFTAERPPGAPGRIWGRRARVR